MSNSDKNVTKRYTHGWELPTKWREDFLEVPHVPEHLREEMPVGPGEFSIEPFALPEEAQTVLFSFAFAHGSGGELWPVGLESLAVPLVGNHGEIELPVGPTRHWKLRLEEGAMVCVLIQAWC
jgi:hypothetical protein